MSPTEQQIRDAIRRENAVTSQPYAIREDRIATGADKAKWKLGSGDFSHRDLLASLIRNRIKGVGPEGAFALTELGNPPEGSATLAFINHGRWMASCSSTMGDGSICLGTEVVDPDDPVFLCLSCLNISNGGKLRPVDFPQGQYRTDIEIVLMARPLVITRGWKSFEGETLQDLIAENIEFGVPVPQYLLDWYNSMGGE